MYFFFRTYSYWNHDYLFSEIHNCLRNCTTTNAANMWPYATERQKALVPTYRCIATVVLVVSAPSYAMLPNETLCIATDSNEDIQN